MSSKAERSLKNYFINPSFQMRMAIYFISAAVAVTGFLLIMMYGYLAEVRSIVANSPGLTMTTQVQIGEVISRVIQISMGFLVLMVVGIWSYALVVSHRIAGPMVAILSFINQLRQGNYTQQRQLRPYDELAPIMQALHELANDLSKKN